MKMTVNRKLIEVPDSMKERKLVEYLREELDLTGVKNACEMKSCGACAVLVNNKSFRICNAYVKDVENCELLTIEGMENEDGTLHPLQQAFIDFGAMQCGFCTPGMIISTKALLDRAPHPTDEEICAALSNNLCRCTGYVKIIEAVHLAARLIEERGETHAG